MRRPRQTVGNGPVIEQLFYHSSQNHDISYITSIHWTDQVEDCPFSEKLCQESVGDKQKIL